MKKLKTFFFLLFLFIAGAWLFALFAVVNIVDKLTEEKEDEECSETD